MALFWINDPLFGLILNGDDISNANFYPVSAGFCVVCILCILFVVLVTNAGRKAIRSDTKICPAPTTGNNTSGLMELTAL